MGKVIKAETSKNISNAQTVISLTKPSPMWATWMFRIVFLLTTAATIIIAGDSDIKKENKIKYMVYMKAFDVVIWGIARGLGVEKKTFEDA